MCRVYSVSSSGLHRPRSEPIPRLPIIATWKRKGKGALRPVRKFGTSVTHARIAFAGYTSEYPRWIAIRSTASVLSEVQKSSNTLNAPKSIRPPPDAHASNSTCGCRARKCVRTSNTPAMW